MDGGAPSSAGPEPPKAPPRRHLRRHLWIGGRVAWLLADVGIIVLYLLRMDISDAPETILLLTFIWTAPLGSLSLLLYNVVRPHQGFSLAGYTLTVPGEVVVPWLLASAAGILQYFVLVPRYFKGEAVFGRGALPRLSDRQAWAASLRVLLLSGAGWILFAGSKLLLVALNVGPLGHYEELRRRSRHLPVYALISELDRLRGAVQVLERFVLWPLAFCMVAILYVWLVHRARLWHFGVLALPAALIEGRHDAVRPWSLFFVYSAWLFLVCGLFRVLRDRRRRPSPPRAELPRTVTGTKA
jgi:hypothetical protein